MSITCENILTKLFFIDVSLRKHLTREENKFIDNLLYRNTDEESDDSHNEDYNDEDDEVVQYKPPIYHYSLYKFDIDLNEDDADWIKRNKLRAYINSKSIFTTDSGEIHFKTPNLVFPIKTDGRTSYYTFIYDENGEYNNERVHEYCTKEYIFI